MPQGGLKLSITPLDIQNKEFERAFRGYDIEDVDDFLDRIAKDLEQLIGEKKELAEQITQLQEKNKNYQKLEETMHNAIVVAQETADEVKQNAKREADLIRREAEREAKQIVEDSRYRANKIMAEQEELFKQAQLFKMRFRSFIEAQLSNLESEDWMDEMKKETSSHEMTREFSPKFDHDLQEDSIKKPEDHIKVNIDPLPESERELEPKPEPKFKLGPDDDYNADHEFKLGPEDDYDSDPEF